MFTIIKCLEYQHPHRHFKRFQNVFSKGVPYKSLSTPINHSCNSPILRWLHLFRMRGLKRRSKDNFSCFVVLGGSAFLGAKIFVGSKLAYCEALRTPPTKSYHDRLIPSQIQDQEDVQEPSLSWLQFWKLLKPQLHYFLAAVLSALVVAIANIKVPLMLGEVVNIISKFTHSQEGQDDTFINEILKPSIKIVKLYLIQAGFTFFYITFLTRMGERMATDLREQLFASLLRQDIAFYDNHKIGELINRLTADVQDFKSSFKMCISQGLRSTTQIIGCGVSLYCVSPHLAAITTGIVSSVIAIGTTLGSLLRSFSRKAQQQVATATAVADECLGNIRTVRAFAMEDQEFKLFSREIRKSEHLNESLGIGIGIFQGGANLFLNGVILGTLYAGGSLLSSGQLQPGDLMSFLVSAQTIQRSLAQLSVLFGTYVRGVSAGARVFEYINSIPEIPLRGGKQIPLHSFMGDVQFKGVTFSYPTRPQQEVLKDLNLKVPASKVVAVVGASGAGKSTFAQLLERFYDVAEGSITIDGIDIRSLDPSWLRGTAIGYINQEPVLFATTLMENIRYGKPEATDQEVIEAARIANAHDFICSFPNGYETVIGERGVTVSGGQKQRVAIARAILKNPSILILDEATSALDAESESIVQAALDNCAQGRTVIVIAHRLSTIRNADIIAVLSQGRLVEIGDHKSLKHLGGIYAELIHQQQKEEEKKKSWSFLS